MTGDLMTTLPIVETAPEPLPVIEGKATGGASEAGWHASDAMFRCWKEYQYGIVRGIRQRVSAPSEALQIGILFHAARASWFARAFKGDDWRAALVEAKQDVENEQNMTVTPETMAYVIDLFEQYIENWRTHPNGHPRVIATELKIGPAPLVAGDPFPLWKTARLDDVSVYHEFGCKLWIGDAKTTSEDFGAVIETYALHGQFLLAIALWNATRAKDLGPVAGIVLDMVRKPYGKQKAKFMRHAFEVPSGAVEWFVQDIRHRTRTAATIDWNTNEPGMHNIAACIRTYGRMKKACSFRDLCLHGQGGTAGYVLRDGSSLQQWAPTLERAVPPWL